MTSTVSLNIVMVSSTDTPHLPAMLVMMELHIRGEFTNDIDNCTHLFRDECEYQRVAARTAYKNKSEILVPPLKPNKSNLLYVQTCQRASTVKT